MGLVDLKHTFQGSSGFYSHLFWDLYNMLLFFEGRVKSVQRGEFHVRAHRSFVCEVEFLLRVLFAQAVQNAFFGSYNEFFGCAFFGVAAHFAGAADEVCDFAHFAAAFRVNHNHSFWVLLLEDGYVFGLEEQVGWAKAVFWKRDDCFACFFSDVLC